MVSSLATIAFVCCLSPHRTTTTVEAFIAPSPPPGARIGGPLSSSSSASTPGSLQGWSGGACLGAGSWWHHCRRSQALLGGNGDHTWDHPRGGKGDRPQLTRMAASSRLNGADISQDLSQLNGAEATPPMDAPAAHSRVSSCFLSIYYRHVQIGACGGAEPGCLNLMRSYDTINSTQAGTRTILHACKVEFQPFKRSYSQLTFFNFL